jgi:hypothetical protein
MPPEAAVRPTRLMTGLSTVCGFSYPNRPKAADLLEKLEVCATRFPVPLSKGDSNKNRMAFQVFAAGSRFRGKANETGGNAMIQKHTTCLNISLLLAAMNCPAGAISTSETPGSTITIHVYNYAAVPEKTVARAKWECHRIFRNAGLTALWVDHALSAGDPRDPHHSTDFWDDNHLVLRLLTQSQEGSSKNAMGEALSLEIANVFMNRVTEQAAVGELSVSRMLGHAIAHEMGHLLLGDNSHSTGGIMLAPWSKRELWRMSKGHLLFTRLEVERIQAEVKYRSRTVLR